MTPTAVSKTDSPTTGQPAIPEDLVGMWNGGPDPGEFWLTMTSDARYELSKARFGYLDNGVVTLDAITITFTSVITGVKVIRQSMMQSSPDLYGSTFLILTLDGYSYVGPSSTSQATGEAV